MANIVTRMQLYILIKYVFLGILLAVASPASGFLLSDDQCVVLAPCTCTLSDLTCTNASLTEIPTLEIVNPKDQGTFMISLNDNNITSVPENAFINVSRVHPVTVTIILSNNDIVNIHPESFKGVENTTYLDLDNNKLTSLPSSLGNLDKLLILSLEQNPISYFDPAILLHLGRSLAEFYVDMHAVRAWPNGFKNLLHLSQLQLHNVDFRYLPLDAFDGQTARLTTLEMDTTLARIPTAVCHIKSLEYLAITFKSTFDSNNSLDVHCPQQLIKVLEINIKGGSLTTFPNFLLAFPSLDRLFLENHGIHFIHTNVIPQSSPLTTLDLSNNSFSHIPFALNKLSNLTYLILSHNQIMTVEDNDLTGILKLKSIHLSFNPIEYIAPDAFKNNQLITNLYLDHTKLHLVSEAVTLLPKLRSFDFRNNNAECSCHLSYLKGWNATRISTFQGDCDDNESIQKYLMSYLPHCP